jgi:F-type H+-transporting ATPase subunit b
MLIDWFTIVAQLINFVILVVALKYLLYDRLMEAMDVRRRSIAEKERAAEERSDEAEEKHRQLERERRDLESRRDEMIDEARRDANDRRRQLMGEAREEVERQEREWKESIRARQERLQLDLQRFTGEKAVAIARRALHDLADESMERTLIRGLVDRIGDLPDDQRAVFIEALSTEGAPLLVRSAFELSDDSRKEIERALCDLSEEPEHEVVWQNEPELIAGIVVQAGAQTVGWTMAGYLDELERGFADLIRSEIGATPAEAEAADPDRAEGSADIRDGGAARLEEREE